MGFLPKDEKIPSDSNYMKLEIGANKFRVLGDALRGQEWWVMKEGKPMPLRRKPKEQIHPDELDADRPQIKYFYAFPVWNYRDQRLQILEITQKTIQREILDYYNNEDWGDPKNYDLTINRTGDGMETRYTVMPSPHKDLPAEVQKIIKPILANIKMENLYTGDDPFENTAQAQAPKNGGSKKEEEVEVEDIPF